MIEYQCDRCRGRVPYKDFDVRVWQCRECAGPAWWVGLKQFTYGAVMLLTMNVMFALGGIMLGAENIGLIPAVVLGVVLGWVGVIALIYYHDQKN